MKKKLAHRLSDISRIHHRAAFADVHRRIAPVKSQFLALAEKRYSCRGFSDAPVGELQLSQIVEAARVAPTAANKQPVHLWVVRTPERLAQIAEATPYLYGAPAAILVGFKAEEAWVRKYDGKNGGETDAAIVGTHIMMEAADLGLGCVWVGSFDPAKIAASFPETAGYEVSAIFPIGHPATDGSANHSVRKSPEDFATEL